jgi:hypothetical protein
MRKVLQLAATVAVFSCGCGQAIYAEDQTAPFPDVNGKMVRIPIAHTVAQCLKNARNLGYPDAQGHEWCTQHCDGTICK